MYYNGENGKQMILFEKKFKKLLECYDVSFFLWDVRFFFIANKAKLTGLYLCVAFLSYLPNEPSMWKNAYERSMCSYRKKTMMIIYMYQ